MRKYHKITPEGTKDLLFEECLTHRYVERTLADVFSSHGFHEVITPGLEFYDVFDTESSGIGQEVMYKMSDKRGRLVCMRPDSTMPIARLTATRLQNLPKPIRLYYTQHIYCNNPGLTGRNDEVMQSGIELLGARGRRADLEVLATAIEALSRCVPNFRIELGHAGFFKAIAAQLPIDDAVREDIRQYIEAKNYAALDMVLMQGRKQVSQCNASFAAFVWRGRNFKEAAKFVLTVLLLKRCLIAGTIQRLNRFRHCDHIMIDLGLVQRTDYYTDIVFSAYVEGCGDAVLTGGRYDNLLASFDAPMPAIGFAMNVDAITDILINNGKGKKAPNVDVLVHCDDGYEMKAFCYAANLVGEGMRCENSVFATRKESLDYAKEMGIPRVDFVGEKIETLTR
ncbi:MAG: ATP phosphoribosyltransferase regulatory subunit [Acutalibacteraceae bacterium]